MKNTERSPLTLISNLFISLYLGSLLAACAPKVYVIDRQTVLEEQAAGNWPDFEKTMLEKAKARGPTPLSKIPESARRARLYNVLNSEMGLASEIKQ